MLGRSVKPNNFDKAELYSCSKVKKRNFRKKCFSMLAQISGILLKTSGDWKEG
jgi:hypothetical protein